MFRACCCADLTLRKALLPLVALALLAGGPACKPRKAQAKVQIAAPVESLRCVAANKGETFLNLLKRFGLDSTRAQAVRQSLSSFDIVNPVCVAGESLVGFFRDSTLYRFEYRQRYDRTYVVEYNPQSSRTQGIKDSRNQAKSSDPRIPESPNSVLSMTYHWVRLVPQAHSGTIRSSLWMAMQNAGLKPDMIIRFADLFSWDVDFFTETQAGDSFKLILEQLYCDGRAVSRPQLQAGEYKGKCGQYYGFFYEDPSGRKDYYLRNGECVRKGFLRSPLQFSRISSYFSTGRYHPILRIVRPHQGIDYSARSGTPVSAIGDGVVAHAGWTGGYGNLVEISHGNGYRSRYGHLSRFGKGVRSGVRVGQGQTIGYVGTTGMSTGPHLHFEVRVNGVARNPLKIIPPRALSLPRQYLPAFQQRADSLKTLLDAPAARQYGGSAELEDTIPQPANQDSAW
jgi:murein DD-endopeptidase MepM/ murein hydrolase activator NlpD